jgi:hypothetical protein
LENNRNAQKSRTISKINFMGATKGPYNPEFPKGSKVRIADRAFLKQFLATWALHNPLRPEQLEQVRGVPGIWHEQCLSTVPKWRLSR